MGAFLQFITVACIASEQNLNFYLISKYAPAKVLDLSLQEVTECCMIFPQALRCSGGEASRGGV